MVAHQVGMSDTDAHHGTTAMLRWIGVVAGRLCLSSAPQPRRQVANEVFTTLYVHTMYRHAGCGADPFG